MKHPWLVGAIALVALAVVLRYNTSVSPQPRAPQPPLLRGSLAREPAQAENATYRAQELLLAIETAREGGTHAARLALAAACPTGLSGEADTRVVEQMAALSAREALRVIDSVQHLTARQELESHLAAFCKAVENP